ncbi:MAG: response regulator [Enterobacterales bacterium]|nr:response regulator [Enterobacterales bacterium]
MPLFNLCLIDDDDIYRETLARSLKRLDCTVVHFSTPQQAIECLEVDFVAETQNELIILLDLKLKNTSGLIWIKPLKKAVPNCSIVLVTGYASIATAVEAIKLGADNYLAKPINAREIIIHLQGGVNQKFDNNDFLPMSVERLEWEYINKILIENDGNISASARALGMHRRTLQRKLAKKPVRK